MKYNVILARGPGRVGVLTAWVLRLVHVLLCFSTLCGSVLAGEQCPTGTRLTLTDATHTVSLGTHAYFLEDKTASLTLSDVMSCDLFQFGC